MWSTGEWKGTDICSPACYSHRHSRMCDPSKKILQGSAFTLLVLIAFSSLEENCLLSSGSMVSAGRKEEKLERAKERPRTGEWDLERSKGQLYSHTLKQTQDPGALAISRTAYFVNVSWCIPFSAADRAILLLSVTFITQRHSTASSRSECYQPPNTESVVFDIENCCISHCMHLHLFNF